MKQNDAVFQAVCSVLDAQSFDSAVRLSKEQKNMVIEMVTDGILNGGVDFSTEAKAKHDTHDKVKSYTTGMVSNHLRKDKRLNGGEKYEIKNPGSRTGSSDAQLKALKVLRTQITDQDQIKLIDEAIDQRIAEITETSTKKIAINVEALPEHLRCLVK